MKRPLLPLLAALLAASATVSPSRALEAAAHPAAPVSTAELKDGIYTLRWTGGAARILASTDPAAAPAAMTVVAADAKGGTASFPEPLGAGVRTYFYIQPKGAPAVRVAARVVPLEGASNFRDLGGYRSADGRRVKWGVIFRANALSDLTEADYRTVKGLNIKLVCDLRTDSERANQPTRWQGIAPDFVTSPKKDTSQTMSTLFGDGPPTAETARRGLMGFYRTAPDTYAEEYRAMFARLLRGQVPMIVHCTAGKDRTGVASALILTALGVPRSEVAADYALTADLLRAGEARRRLSPGYRANMAAYNTLPAEAMHALEGSEPAYIEASLDAVAAKYGSVDAYLETVLGVGPAERAALQRAYLE